MKKLIAVVLALVYTSAAGFALADVNGGAGGGKKRPAGKHSKKHGKHANKDKVSTQSSIDGERVKQSN